MRCGLAQVAVLLAACLVTGEQSVHGQTVANPFLETVPDESCPRSTAHDQSPSGPEIPIEGVSFSGALQMPAEDQNEIAESVKRETHGNSVEGVTDEALERVRAGWQNRGYFKADFDSHGLLCTGIGRARRSSDNSNGFGILF